MTTRDDTEEEQNKIPSCHWSTMLKSEVPRPQKT